MTHRTVATIVPTPNAWGVCREPTLDEILSDSVIKAVMRADAVDPGELRALLDKVGQVRHAAARANGY